jgi:hypothetical protein
MLTKWYLKKFLAKIATSYIIRNFKHLIGDDVSSADLFYFIDYDLSSKPIKITKSEKTKIEKLFN